MCRTIFKYCQHKTQLSFPVYYSLFEIGGGGGDINQQLKQQTTDLWKTKQKTNKKIDTTKKYLVLPIILSNLVSTQLRALTERKSAYQSLFVRLRIRLFWFSGIFIPLKKKICIFFLLLFFFFDDVSCLCDKHSKDLYPFQTILKQQCAKFCSTVHSPSFKSTSAHLSLQSWGSWILFSDFAPHS